VVFALTSLFYLLTNLRKTQRIIRKYKYFVKCVVLFYLIQCILVDEYWSFGAVCFLHFQVLLSVKMEEGCPPPQLQFRIQEDRRLYHHSVIITRINYVTLIHNFVTYKTIQGFNLCSTLCSFSCPPVLAVPVLCL
jgi:hypothetical protein